MDRTRLVRIVALLSALGLLGAAWALFRCQDRSNPPAAAVADPPIREAGESASSRVVVAPEPAVVIQPLRPRALTMATGIAGRVLDEDGRPIAGAAITVVDKTPIADVRVGESGRFEVPDLEPGRYDVVAESSGFGSIARLGVAVEPGRVTTTDLVLPPRPEHLGRVLDPAGEPAAGADVTISYRLAWVPDAPASWAIRRVSDGLGWFSFPWAGDPRFTAVDLRAHKDGVGDSQERASWFNPATTVHTVHLKAGEPETQGASSRGPFGGSVKSGDGIVDGTVVDGSGRPIEGMTIGSQTSFMLGRTVTTDGEGRFQLTGVERIDNCRIGARRGRGPRTWSSSFDLVRAATLTGVTIVMGIKPELVVEVVGIDGRRVEGATVLVEEEGGGDFRRSTANTDRGGRAEFGGLGSTSVFVTLDPACLPSGVRADDEFKNRVDLNLGDGRPVVIRLRPEVRLRGTVVLEDGSPVEQGVATFDVATIGRGGGTSFSLGALKDGAFPNATSLVELTAPKYERLKPNGEFTVRVGSVNDYELAEISRVVRRADSDHPELEVFVPVRRSVLRADVENRVVVRRRP